MPGPDYFARLGADAEVDPEALPIEQRFIDDGVAKQVLDRRGRGRCTATPAISP
jgi:hypothetical protein